MGVRHSPTAAHVGGREWTSCHAHNRRAGLLVGISGCTARALSFKRQGGGEKAGPQAVGWPREFKGGNAGGASANAAKLQASEGSFRPAWQ